MTKKCKRCHQVKPLDQYSAAPKNADNLLVHCKACAVLKYMDYMRTPKGWANATIHRQRSSSKHRGHPPPTYTHTELFAWACERGLLELIDTWRESDYGKDLAPSVDRLDDHKGYSFDNIRLVIWRVNNYRNWKDRKSGKRITRQNKAVRQLAMDGTFICEYVSASEAARMTGAQRPNITNCCRENSDVWQAGGFLWEFV